jgi:hypothetical protein
MNSMGNKIWLGEIVDWDLLFHFPKGIWIWLDELEDPQAFVFQQREGERELKYMIRIVDLTFSTKKKGL